MAKRKSRLWKQVIHRAQEFDKWTTEWVRLVIGAAKKALDPDSTVRAATIAYFAIFSLFPITLLSVAIASLSLGSLIDQHSVVQRLEFIAPALGQMLGENIDEIIQARGSVTIVALIGLVWSASTIFYVLTGTMNTIWGAEQRAPYWKRRGKSILFVMVFVGPVLVLASFADNLIASLLTGLPDQVVPILSGSSLFVTLLLDVAFFMLIYLMLPHGRSTWRQILPGAIAAGLLWEVAKKIFLLFVSTYISVSNLVYGSVATIIAFLIWAYLSGIILLFGSFLSVAYYKAESGKTKRPWWLFSLKGS